MQQNLGQQGGHQHSDISKEIQKAADSLKSQIESKINLKFNQWDVSYFERYPSDSHHQAYFIKVNTDNNGHVRFKASQLEKLSSWNLEEIEEFDRGNVSIPENAYQTQSKGSLQQGQGLSQHHADISKEIQSAADSLKSQIESKINLKFKEWDVSYFERYPSDLHHQAYFIKVNTDNNGHVRFKMSQTDKLSSWNLEEIEEFDRGNVNIPDNAYQVRTKESLQQGQGLKSGQMNVEPANP